MTDNTSRIGKGLGEAKRVVKLLRKRRKMSSTDTDVIQRNWKWLSGSRSGKTLNKGISDVNLSFFMKIKTQIPENTKNIFCF